MSTLELASHDLWVFYFVDFNFISIINVKYNHISLNLYEIMTSGVTTFMCECLDLGFNLYTMNLDSLKHVAM